MCDILIGIISDCRNGVAQLKMKKLASGACAVLFIAVAAGIGFWVKKYEPQNFVIETQTEAVTPSPASAAPEAEGAQAPEGSTDGKININTATAAELDKLDGVGDKIAQRIIDYREAHGPFEVPEDLMKVSGIGTKKFAAIKDAICVE